MTSRIRSFLSSNSRPRLRRNQAGFTVVETVIFVPTIFLMTFLTLEITNMMRIYEQVSWTAEYGVRQASEGMDADNQRFSEEVSKEAIGFKLVDFFGFDIFFDPGYEPNVCFDYAKAIKDMPDTFEYCSNNDDDKHSSDLGAFAGPGDFVRVKVEIPYKPIFAKLPYLPKVFHAMPFSATFTRVISSDYTPE